MRERRSSVIKPVVVRTAFLGLSEKFNALLKSVDNVAIEPSRLGLTLHSLVFKKRESMDYALENIVPGINNVIRIIKNKRRIPRRLFQRSNKLLFIKILDVIVVCSVLFCCTPLYFLVTMVGR